MRLLIYKSKRRAQYVANMINVTYNQNFKVVEYER